jgi:hypothetical protein
MKAHRRRGRLNEGAPTKRTPELIVQIAKAISLGLTDEETCALVGIDPNTLMNWKKDSEFLGAIKSAVAARLVKRLERIETGANGWQGCAWLTERLMPTRYAKPEVQISLNTASGEGNQAHVITISLEEAERIEAEAAPIREMARQLIENYQRNRNGSHSPRGQRRNCRCRPVERDNNLRASSGAVRPIPARPALMLSGGLFLAFMALSVLQTPGPNAWPSFTVMVLVAGIILFNMKKTKFCDQCGAFVRAQWETPKFCPKCGAELPN